jgi:hypothetical protein
MSISSYLKSNRLVILYFLYSINTCIFIKSIFCFFTYKKKHEIKNKVEVNNEILPVIKKKLPSNSFVIIENKE